MSSRGRPGGLFCADEWNIGLTRSSLEDLLEQAETAPDGVAPSVRWPAKPWFVRFRADPFLLEHDGKVFLYFEEVLVGSNRGRLRWTQISADGDIPARPARMIDFDRHVSYPYVFEHSGSFFCVPETGQYGQVMLFESSSPVGPWRQRAIILKDVPARDSSLFAYDGRWWLFCTVAGASARSHLSDLHVWHAPEPWGPWVPHSRRPVKADIHSSRPAGRPFLLDGVLYRPAQDCSGYYGMRAVLNRVVRLDPDEFDEEVCAFLLPDSHSRYAHGLHTITTAGGLVAIDGYNGHRTLNPFKVASTALARARGRFGPTRIRHA